MLLNAQQLALEILSNMCCPDGENVLRVVKKNLYVIIVHIVHYVLVTQFCGSQMGSHMSLLCKRSSSKSSAISSGS